MEVALSDEFDEPDDEEEEEEPALLKRARLQPKRLSQELPAKRAEGKSKKQVRLHVAAPSLP